MPPKSKKSLESKKSRDSNRPSASGSRISLKTKDQCSIFILNIQTEGIQSILKEFIAQAKSHKRRVVVPIVLNEIAEELSLEKVKTTTDQQLDEGSSGRKVNSASSYYPSPDEIFNSTKAKIAKCIDENNALLAKLNSIKKLDLLQYWQQSAASPMNMRKSEKGDKGGKGRTSVVSAKETKSKDARKSKERVSKLGKMNVSRLSAYGDNVCALGAIPSIKLQANILSQFTDDNIENKVLEKYVTDHPEDGPILYIIIIGTVLLDYCLNLIRDNYPLASVISVCPKMEENSIAAPQSLSDALAMYDETKSIALTAINFPTILKCDTVKKSSEIYDEISWMMYDIEVAKRQYRNYLANLNEIDVSVRPDSVKLAETAQPFNTIPKYFEDSITVPLYLDNLLNIVANAVDELVGEASEQESCHNMRIFPCLEVEGKLVVEHKNHVMRLTIANSAVDENIYLRCLEQKIKYGMANQLRENIQSNRFDRHSSYSPSGSSTGYESISSLQPGRDFAYVELLSRDAIVQTLDYLNNLYDYYFVEYSVQREELEICFHNANEQYTEASSTFYIPTRVCFRDYCKYVTDEINEWTNEQEILYEQQLIRDNKDQNRLKTLYFDDITDGDFIFNPSLKTNMDLSPIRSQTKTIASLKSYSQMVPTDMLTNVLSTTTIANRSPAPFTVYNIGDTRYQITATKATFRTTAGPVRILEDKFTRENVLVRVDIDYLGIHFLHNHTYPSQDVLPYFKVIVPKSSDISIYMIAAAAKRNLSSEVIDETTSESNSNEIFFEASLTWPSGLQIRTVRDRDSGQLIYIEQEPMNSDTSEIKRLYYPTGVVAIFHNNGFIDVLTPSGTIYETIDSKNANLDLISVHSGTTNEGIQLAQIKFTHERTFFEKLHKDFFKEKYKMTTSDGYIFETFAGSIIHEERRLHLCEWCDYARGESHAMLEGGIKTRLYGNSYQVYYPNGTLITTGLEDYLLDEELDDEESKSNLSLGKSEEVHVEKSALQATENILDQILENISKDQYVTCNRTFLIQHENYASIHFDKDRIKISCPNQTDITLKSNELQINIKNEFYVDCNSEKCFIRGCKYPDQNNQVEATFNFVSDIEPFLHVKSGIDAELKVNQNGHREHILKSNKCQPKMYRPREKRLVLSPLTEGYEIYTASEVDNITTTAQKNNAIVVNTEECVTILKRLENHNDKFKMPIPNIENFLSIFVQKGRPCDRISKPSVNNLKEIPDLMTVQTFLEASVYFRRKNPSTAEIFSRRASSVDDVCFNVGKEDNVLRFLKQQATRAISSYIEKNSRKDSLNSKLLPASSIISLKMRSFITNLNERRQREIIYHKILRHKFVPKYFDFQEAEWKIQNLDVMKYEELLNQLDNIPRPPKPEAGIVAHKKQSTKRSRSASKYKKCISRM